MDPEHATTAPAPHAPLEGEAPASGPATPALEGGRLAGALVVGLLGLAGACWALGRWYRAPLEALGAWLVERLGLGFVAGGVFLLDVSPVPLVTEPVLVLATTGGLPWGQVVAVAATASVSAGLTCYLGGGALARRGLARRLAGAGEARARELVRRHGLVTIALAAITPLPFAICAWSAGALGMRLGPFLLGLSLRVPKVAFYAWVIDQSWRAGALR